MLRKISHILIYNNLYIIISSFRFINEKWPSYIIKSPNDLTISHFTFADQTQRTSSFIYFSVNYSHKNFVSKKWSSIITIERFYKIQSPTLLHQKVYQSNIRPSSRSKQIHFLAYQRPFVKQAATNDPVARC